MPLPSELIRLPKLPNEATTARIQRVMDFLDKLFGPIEAPFVDVHPREPHLDPGSYRPSFVRSGPSMGVNFTFECPELSFLHEVAHYIDAEVFGAGRDYASDVAEGPILDVLASIWRSDAYIDLEQHLHDLLHNQPTGVLGEVWAHKVVLALTYLSNRECFAIAFSHWLYAMIFSDESNALRHAKFKNDGLHWNVKDYAKIKQSIGSLVSPYGSND